MASEHVLEVPMRRHVFTSEQPYARVLLALIDRQRAKTPAALQPITPHW